MCHRKPPRFYQLVVRSEPEVFGGPTYGTRYSLEEACPACGAGAVRVGPLIMRKLRPRKGPSIFMTLNGEVLLTDDIAEVLRKERIGQLGDVVRVRSFEPQPFKVLDHEAVLPRFSNKTTGYQIEDQCQHCKRSGYFNMVEEDLVLMYEGLQEELLEKDVLATYERFGNSRLREPFEESVFAAPIYVVSSRFAEILGGLKPRGVEFEPVHIA